MIVDSETKIKLAISYCLGLKCEPFDLELLEYVYHLVIDGMDKRNILALSLESNNVLLGVIKRRLP